MKYRGLFLVKHAVAASSANRLPRSSRADFVTLTREVSFDALPEEMRIISIERRPPREELTVGRSADCGIVLRYPFVSKQHARVSFSVEGGLVVVDTGSSNGTFCNERALKPGHSQRVSIGETVGFGALRMELCDADRLHCLLAVA